MTRPLVIRSVEMDKRVGNDSYLNVAYLYVEKHSDGCIMITGNIDEVVYVNGRGTAVQRVRQISHQSSRVANEAVALEMFNRNVVGLIANGFSEIHST